MKFIFSFLFSFLFLQPVLAQIASETDCDIEEETDCRQQPGCKWIDWCEQCEHGYACSNGQQTQCPAGFDSDWATQHKAHPDGASLCNDFICTDGHVKSNDGQSCILNCSGITEPKFLPDGETNCDNWQCRAGYYRGGTNNDECKQCPDNSENCTTDGIIYGLTAETVTCEYGYVKSVSNGVVTCEQCSCTQPENGSCTATYNETTGGCQTTITCDVGYYKTETSGTVSCTACPQHSTTDNTGSTSISECKCYSGYYRGGTNMDVCIQCTGELSCSGTGLTYSNTSNPNGFSCSDGWQLVPNNATKTYSCQSCSDSNATLENGNCKCKQNYYGTIAGLDTQCTACPQHSTTDGAGSTGISACKCDIGYYDAESDAESVSCQKCPIGMTTVTLDSNGNPTNTTTNGATSIEHCAMPPTSEFCFTNPNSTNRQLICTPLIPSGATKINGRTISTTTNSGN
jgi:hypothetical protein